MTFNRRVAQGRIAELAGPAALDTDRFLRTLGIYRAAQSIAARLDAQTRAQLEAYAAGVNAHLAKRTGPLPPEFLLARADAPEAWQVADSIAWVLMMALDLSRTHRDELTRLRLAAQLTRPEIDEIKPPYPGDPPAALADYPEMYRLLGLFRPSQRPGSGNRTSFDGQSLALFAGLGDREALGSNNWVVSGTRTITGKPMLANDPHLGLTTPSVWYFARLRAPQLEVFGATLPGVPYVLLGRNRRVAWGFTNTGPDVQDLYVERLDGAGNYLTPEGPKPFTVRDEVIKVKGGQEIRLQVRVTRHGPVISDASRTAQEAAPRGHVIAMQWTALREDDLTMQAAVKMARARDWPGFVAALRDYHSPQQNIVYADTQGNIGFVAAGRVPIRKPENDLKGLAPAPGWLAKYDWAGFIPYEELPRAHNPADGTVVTANHRITPRGYPHYITNEWQPPYRANRISELLGALPKHSIASFARIQGDVVSLPVRDLLPRLAKVTPKSDAGRRALALLAKWDGNMTVERPEPLIVSAWWREFSRAIYADELGDSFRGNWFSRAQFLTNVLQDKDKQGRWCDNMRTKTVETCDELLAVTLDAALADLKKRYGEDMAAWRWGEAHYARHEHRPFGRVSWLAPFFDITVPTPGDTYTVNVGRNRLDDNARPFANIHAASLRAIYDLANLENSLYIHSGGQSGNVFSPHYKSFTQAWARGEYIPMVTDSKRIEAGGVKRLRLLP
jgi:penicillin amidase